MISYNFPYRGPFEYDKAAISILSYMNEAIYIKQEIENKTLGIHDLIARVNQQFEEKIVNSKSRKACMIIEKIR